MQTFSEKSDELCVFQFGFICRTILQRQDKEWNTQQMCIEKTKTTD